ncbi:hypothetical protein MRX96_008181 [Rhipicephalus microplus]
MSLIQKFLFTTQVCLFVASIGAKLEFRADEYGCATQVGASTGSTCREDYHIEDIGYQPLLLPQQPQMRSLSLLHWGLPGTVTSSVQPIKDQP